METKSVKESHFFDSDVDETRNALCERKTGNMRVCETFVDISGQNTRPESCGIQTKNCRKVENISVFIISGVFALRKDSIL